MQILGDIILNKNEFRHLKKNDLIEHKPWYRDLYESIKDDIRALMSLIDGREKAERDE